MNQFNAVSFSTDSVAETEEYGEADEIGEWRLVKEIGAGAFSKVWEGVRISDTTTTPAIKKNIPKHTLSTVAIKIVKKCIDDDYPSIAKCTPDEYLLQVDKETALWSRLHHVNVLEMVEVIRTDECTIGIWV